uniref:Uncharacterized protein n=1 Tax=Anguilla anguilla TaxID=7936 RepID=A0A0E9TSJ9_ANGAN
MYFYNLEKQLHLYCMHFFKYVGFVHLLCIFYFCVYVA